MALPTRKLSDISGMLQQTQIIYDGTDTNPFFSILDANGRILATGVNLAALVDPKTNLLGPAEVAGPEGAALAPHAGVLASADTITPPGAAVSKVYCAPAGNVTGIIVAAGAFDGQLVSIINNAAFTVTFAAAGTSHVLGGTAVVIPVSSGILLQWDATAALWVPLVTANLNVGAVTATATEINVLHGVTPGTAGASLAAVLGASKDLDTLQLDAALLLAAGVSVAFGATMALVVATPVITVAASHTTSATATINCAAVAPAGAVLVLVITEGAGTGTVVTTFGTHFKSTGTLTTASSGKSTITFVGDGTNWNEIGRAATLA